MLDAFSGLACHGRAFAIGAAGLSIVMVAPAESAVPYVPPEVLAPHRAIYDLSLVETRDQAGVSGAQGRLVYELRRPECKGFALTYRQAMKLQTGEGQAGVVDFRSQTDEDDAFRVFDFTSESIIGAEEPTRIAGRAERKEGDGASVSLQEPQAKTTAIPTSVMFPTQHLRRILEAARSGEKTVETLVFDGGEPGDEPTHTFAIIGAVVQPGEDRLDDTKGFDGLDRLPRWPVTISYFDVADGNGGEQTPKFIFNAELFENGIARQLRLDYGRFVVEGRLTRVESLPADCSAP